MSKVGFIYKLAHNDTEIKEIYIGSTSNLKRRKYQHKRNCITEANKSYNLNVYQFIRSNGGFVNWNIFQIEEVKYNTKYELHARERYHIELLNPALNKSIPTRTKEEWYIDNKEEILEQRKQYHNDNKAIILERAKKYYNDNKKTILKKVNQYRNNHKEEISEKKKQYQRLHNESHNNSSKKYYEENKQEIHEKAKQKFNCDCGGFIRIADKSTHNKTQKHQAYINTQSDSPAPIRLNLFEPLELHD